MARMLEALKPNPFRLKLGFPPRRREAVDVWPRNPG